MKLDAESYLKSGSNELRVLEYTISGHSFGINILKVQKILSRPECLTAAINSHPAVLGMFKDNNGVIPLVDLGYFLGFEKSESIEGKKIVVTEFFNVLNGFIVDTVEWIHHFVWENVINANDVLKTIDQKYIISIVKPDGERMVPLLDYETIILDLCPELASKEMHKISEHEYDASGQRVLIAEDSPSVRNMLVTELEELGFDVVSAADGKEAIAILEEDKNFNLVISDVEMPQLDGLALTTAIRSTPEIANMPVIVYSSIGDMGMKARADFLKADAHVTKLSVEELMEQVIKFTSGETKPGERVVETQSQQADSEDKPVIEETEEETVSVEADTVSSKEDAVGAGADVPVDEAASGQAQTSDSDSVAVEAAATAAIAEMEATDQASQSEAYIEEFLDEKIEELTGTLGKIEAIAEVVESDSLDDASGGDYPEEDQTKPENSVSPSLPETESADKSQSEQSGPKLKKNCPNIIVEAERVTVAAAKTVTIVDAGSVSIDNVSGPMETPDKVKS